MKKLTWNVLIISGCILIGLSATGAAIYHWTTLPPEPPEPCRNQSDLRRVSDDRFKCPVNADLEVRVGTGIPIDSVLNICTCRAVK